MKLQSLRARLLLWVSVALVALFAITIVVLFAIYRRGIELELRDELQVQLLGLIAAAEESDDEELSVPDDAGLDRRMTLPESGLYGAIWDADGVSIWRSNSWAGRDWFVDRFPVPGERIYLNVDEPDLPPLENLLMGIRWDFHDGSSLPYTFGVGVAREPYALREGAFLRNLIGWFASITVTMLVVLIIVLRVALRPLRQLVGQVAEVETGGRQAVDETLSPELTGLARNLNLLIDSERRRTVRYRNTLDDLAHSLKTPLAAIRALLSERSSDNDALARALDLEVGRMDQRIGYQLRRARASGSTGLGLAPVALAPIVNDIVSTLDKVYRDKQVSCELDVDARASYQADAGDLSEIVGNLLDNAYKYCARRVLLELRDFADRIEIVTHDDGPGLPVAAQAAVIERGARADESVPGQGIGLAVVAETAELYRGRLRFGVSELGGTAVTVVLPRPRTVARNQIQ
jgi:two-component system sensor histidine kinase PhoQ